jgi:hypothetical protein
VGLQDLVELFLTGATSLSAQMVTPQVLEVLLPQVVVQEDLATAAVEVHQIPSAPTPEQ